MLHPCCLQNPDSLRRVGANLVACPGCGMVWQQRQPTDEELARIYSAGYYDSWGGTEGIAPYWSLKLALADRLLDHIPAAEGPLNVLDIGCATGACLSAIARRGWTPFGLDVNEHAVALSTQRVPQAEVRAGTTVDVPEWRGRFDAVVMSDVIEHVRDPLLEMARVAELLKPGGRLVLLTPDVRSLSARLMGRHWIHRKEEHLFYFSRMGLRKLLERTGFSAHSVLHAPKPMTLGYAVNQFRSYHVPVLSGMFRLLDVLLPGAAKGLTFSIPMGEMLAIARKDPEAP